MNPPFNFVKMFGPCLKGSGVLVDADVAEGNVKAFEAAGYKKGSLPVHEPVVYSEAQAIAHTDGEDVSKKPKGKAKK